MSCDQVCFDWASRAGARRHTTSNINTQRHTRHRRHAAPTNICGTSEKPSAQKTTLAKSQQSASPACGAAPHNQPPDSLGQPKERLTFHSRPTGRRCRPPRVGARLSEVARQWSAARVDCIQAIDLTAERYSRAVLFHCATKPARLRPCMASRSTGRPAFCVQVSRGPLIVRNTTATIAISTRGGCAIFVILKSGRAHHAHISHVQYTSRSSNAT
jgi:hypothetical protein